jgi:hypothetical protein
MPLMHMPPLMMSAGRSKWRCQSVVSATAARCPLRSRDRGESWEDCTQDLLRFAEQEKYKSRIVSQTPTGAVRSWNS